VTGNGIHESLSVTDCVLIARALAFVGGVMTGFDNSPDGANARAQQRMGELAAVFQRAEQL
jgi:hypothetical protein